MLRELQCVRPRGSSVFPEKGQAFIIVYNLVSLLHLHSAPRLHISPSKKSCGENPKHYRENPPAGTILAHVPRDNTFWLAKEQKEGRGGVPGTAPWRWEASVESASRTQGREGVCTARSTIFFAMHSSNTQHSSQDRGNYVQRFGG